MQNACERRLVELLIIWSSPEGKIMKFSRLLFGLSLAVVAINSVCAAADSLPALGADAKQTSVSGLSSGAFMAVQLQVAYSNTFIGAGIIAGGPYYCAAAGLLTFTEICMGQVWLFPPNPYLMVNAAKGFAANGQIDSLAHLGQRRVYIFSGTDDSVVRQPAVAATATFFQLVGVKPENLKYENKLPAGHAVITPSYGNDCAANAPPYINHCVVNQQGYDQAGALLSHIYGELAPRVDLPAGQIIAFDQRAYASKQAAMAATGYLYVPPGCRASGANCRVHVAIHGCVQSFESVGDQFYTDTGYNHWADNNRLLILYPQINKTDHPYNPKGCWDWWGYTGMNYATKSSPQMKAITAMVKHLTQSP
jgi:poly(3-hydroxybutyrate) depolymerase